MVTLRRSLSLRQTLAFVGFEERTDKEPTCEQGTASAPLQEMLRQPKPPNQHRCLKGAHSASWLRLVWATHFLATALILFAGVLNNRGRRKYIRAPLSKGPLQCKRAFVNVLASSEKDQDAAVCCGNPQEMSIPGLCKSSQPTFIPLAGRLARFPDAWLFPLFPFLVRSIYSCFRAFAVKPIWRSWAWDLWSAPVVRRLLLYLGLMNVRGWMLYIALNRLEDWLFEPAQGPCWYQELLYDYRPNCYGRTFNFSDHVVFYFAHILPIALVEVLHSFDNPYWKHQAFSDGVNFPVLFLIAGMVYLYLVAFLGAFTTASYFHTGPEIFVGFVVSLVVQLPLCWVQCGGRSQSTKGMCYSFVKARDQNPTRTNVSDSSRLTVNMATPS